MGYLTDRLIEYMHSLCTVKVCSGAKENPRIISTINTVREVPFLVHAV